MMRVEIDTTEAEETTETESDLAGDRHAASTLPIRGRLPPLQTGKQEESQPLHQPLPGIEPAPLGGSPTKGGSVYDNVSGPKISIPEGGGSVPEKADTVGRPLVSIPGDITTKHTTRDMSYGGGQGKPLDMVIYFLDKTGLQLSLQDGQHAEAGELFELVLEEMKYPPIAREAFSLWLVSDLLELQLKPNQCPFKLVCYWEELLEKYTDASPQDIERDEPVITFQRNVFFLRQDDKKVVHYPELLWLLYNEAKENIIDGRYPLKTTEVYHRMAGLQALIEYRGWEPNVYTPEYFKKRTSEFYPEKMCRKKFSQKKRDSPEYHLPQYMREAHGKFGSLTSSEAHSQACRHYLEECWKLPFYGAAFFAGQIEHPASKYRLRTVNDDPVFIAVNPEGVYIIDMDDVIFLMGLKYKDLQWEYAEPSDRTKASCIPCIFIQFKVTEEGERLSKVLQVFSRQAVLADGMIEACLKLRSHKNYTSDPKGIQIDACDDVWRTFNRLCLATFNKHGECVSNKARVSSTKSR